MITTISQNNTVTIPAEVARRLGIKPGCQLDWRFSEDAHEIVLRVLPDREERARQLLGAGKRFSPARNGVAELIAERETEG